MCTTGAESRAVVPNQVARGDEGGAVRTIGLLCAADLLHVYATGWP